MLHHPARGPELGPRNRRAGKLPFDEPQQVLHRYTAIQQLNHLFDAESRMLAYDGKLENAHCGGRCRHTHHLSSTKPRVLP